MDAAQATQTGLAIGGILAAIGGWGTVWMNRRNAVDGATVSQAQISEKRRQDDIDTIIETLQGQVTSLLSQLTSVQAEAKTARNEAAECMADRLVLHAELNRVNKRLTKVEHENTTLRQQIAKLTRAAASVEVDGAGE